MANLQCPLNYCVIAMLPSQTRMNLARVLEIEQHVSSAGPCIHPPLADLLLYATQDGNFAGTTPLLLACDEGHLDAVERIVQVWHADVNAAANYYRLDGFTHSNIVEAAPLFVAALRGHIDIVRYLIAQGANVSALTSTQDNPEYDGLTALHGALMEDRPGLSFSEKRDVSYIIARLLLEAGADPNTRASDGTPVWMRKFCGVAATIALINHGLNVNQPNSWGKTILHYWITSWDVFTRGIIEEERVVVVRLLLDSGADPMARDCKGFSPILISAEFGQLATLNELLERSDIDRNEKIDALDLAGALLLLSSGFSSENIRKAYGYWRHSLQLRGEPEPINKIPLQMTNQWAVEWATRDHLEDVIEEPGVYWIQAMITRLRVYSNRSEEAVRYFIEKEFFNSFFKDSDDFLNVVDEEPTKAHIQDLMLETLGAFLRFGPYAPLLWEPTQKLVRELTDSLTTPSLLSDAELVRINLFLQLILAADPDRRLVLEYEFFVMLTRLPYMLQNEVIRQYASPSARLHAGILLFQSCNRGDWKTLRLLLHLGADPNSSYYRGNRPLHIVAGQEESPANLLFNYGAQPYAINDEGKCAVQIWMEKNCGGEGMQSSAWTRRPLWCRDTVPKLSSLAAKTIHTHGINYSPPGNVPVDCLLILENH